MEQAELTLQYRELDRDCALLSYRIHGPNEFEPKLFIPDEEAVAGVRETWRELGRRVEELADPELVNDDTLLLIVGAAVIARYGPEAMRIGRGSDD